MTLKCRYAFNIDSIKISPQITPVAETPAAETPSPQITIDDPIRTMFIRYQQKLESLGKKRLSYPREYKLAAIEEVKSGKSR